MPHTHYTSWFVHNWYRLTKDEQDEINRATNKLEEAEKLMDTAVDKAKARLELERKERKARV